MTAAFFRVFLVGGVCLLGVSGVATAQVFEDVAPQFGLVGDAAAVVKNATASGVAWFDADGDGKLDLLHCPPAAPPVLIRQTSSGLVADPFGVDLVTPPGYAHGGLPFDMDRDGDLDLLLIREGTNVLFANDDGVFIDVTAGRLPGTVRRSVGFAVGDVDGDGDDDLFVGAYTSAIAFPTHKCGRNELLINNGEGQFVDRAEAWGVTGTGCTLAVAMSDYDGDGDLDLLVANDFGNVIRGNELYRNDGPTPDGWAFTDVSAESGFGERVFGMGIASGDPNNDGWLDYYTTSIGLPRLILGGPDGFEEATEANGLDIQHGADGEQVAWEAWFEDIDADGWVDLFAAGGDLRANAWELTDVPHGTNLLFAGGPDGFEFEPKGWKIPAPTWSMGRSGALGDYNADGRIDIALGHAHGLLSIFRQTEAASKPLRVVLTPTETGPTGSGARVTAICGGVTRMRELTGGGSFVGASERVIWLSFPGTCQASGQPVALTVRWPSGYVQELTAASGGLLELEEPDWLLEGAGGVTVDLNGSALTGDVELVAPGLSAAVETEPGVWTATFADAKAGDTAVVTINIGGAPLAVHPRVVWPAAGSFSDIYVSPQHMVTGRPVTFYLTPRAPDGQELGPGLAVSASVDGKKVAATDLGDGRYGVSVTAPAAGELALQALLDGAALGPAWLGTVGPRVSTFETALRFENTAVVSGKTGQSPLKVVAVLRDANGEEVAASDVSLKLTVDGVQLKPTTQSNSGSQVKLQFASGGLADMAQLQLWVNGEPVGGVRTRRVLAKEADVAALVDPLQSRSTFTQMAMYADGIDTDNGMIYLHDAAGDALPPGDVQPVMALTGTEFIEGTKVTAAGRWLYHLRAGTVAGVGTASVWWHGVELGVVGEVGLWAPPPLPDSVSATMVPDPEVLVAGTGDMSELDILPRDAKGRLVGSGLTLELSATLGTVSSVDYIGDGLYRGTLTAGWVDGISEVVATVAAPVAEISGAVTLLPGVSPPADDGVAEPIEDVAEPIADVAEPFEDVAELFEDVAEPFEDVAEPFEDVAEPIEDVAEPVEDVAEPVEDVAEPFEDMAEPFEDVAEPIEDVAEPVEDVAEPFEDVAEPFEDVAEPVEDVALVEDSGGAEWVGPVLDAGGDGGAQPAVDVDDDVMGREAGGCSAGAPRGSGPGTLLVGTLLVLGGLLSLLGVRRLLEAFELLGR